MIGMLCTAFSFPSRAIQTIRCCPLPGSFSLILDWVGYMLDFVVALVVFRLSVKPNENPSAPMDDHLSIRPWTFWHSALATASAASSLPDGPIRFPKHLSSVHDHGRLRSSRQGFTIHLALRRPDCTSSRSSKRGRRACDPVDSDPGARLPWSPPLIKPKLAKVLSVSPHS